MKTLLKRFGSRATFLKLTCPLWVSASRPLGIHRGIMGLILIVPRVFAALSQDLPVGDEPKLYHAAYTSKFDWRAVSRLLCYWRWVCEQ
jgi:hypothetical protein